MLLEHYLYNNKGWDKEFNAALDSTQTHIIVFSTYSAQQMRKPLEDITKAYEEAIIIGTSTAGNILMDEILEESVLVSVVKFSNTSLKLATKSITSMQNSLDTGRSIAKELYSEELQSLFILSDGLHINGSQLVEGISLEVSENIKAFGALGADNAKFEATWIVVHNEAKEYYVSAVGFYGNAIHMAYASKDGLDKFGIQRLVTKSDANILYELDDRPALEIYKEYLGEKAKELPGSALYFPLSIETEEGDTLIRTILSVNHEDDSMIFAGNIPQGTHATFMKANYDRVIDGAGEAALALELDPKDAQQFLTIAISCIGRKLTLKQRTEEELEAVLEVLPKNNLQIGLYSFGEISPNEKCCELHNQTMTLTVLWEEDA